METRKLYIRPYDRMIKDLVSEIEREDIILDPEYQRNYVWDNKKASLLIESILLNVPIPVLYAAENEQYLLVIVDGLQRLTSLYRFYKNEFKLTGLETLSEINGKKYDDLNPEIQRKLNIGQLRIIVIQKESDPEIQFDIFQRLNTGSVQLNEQELRNCIYRGKYNEMIKTVARENEVFKRILPKKQVRMQPEELVLRYLSFSEKFNKESLQMNNYDGRIKNLLNYHMKAHQQDSESLCTKDKEKFNNQVCKAYEVYGADAFKIKAGTKINSPLYECIMISFEDYDINTLLKYKNEIVRKTNELFENAEFLNAITKATGNTENTNYRIKTFIEMVKGIVQNER